MVFGFICLAFLFWMTLYRTEGLLKKEIRNSVTPKFLDISVETKALVDLSIAFWRLEQKLNKRASNIADEEEKSVSSSLNRIRRYLEIHDIEVQDHTGKMFNEGLNVDVLSFVKENNINSSIIKETVEPTVLLKGQLVQKAKVVVSKGI